MKYYKKIKIINKESLCLKYWDINNLYGWGVLQKLLVNKFEQIKYNSHFNEDFIKSHNKESDERYFPEVDIQHPEKLHELHNDLPCFPGRMKLAKVERRRNYLV